MGGDGTSEDVPGEEAFRAQVPEWARERADGRWYSSPTAGRSPQRAKAKAPTNLIVVLPDEGGDEWAKARVFEDPGDAAALVETLVETLVESGLPPDQVSIFGATRLTLDVAYQPVVELKERRKQEKAPG